jgi:hypothetical protein
MAMPVLKATGVEQNACPHTGLHSAASSYDPSLHSAAFHRHKRDAAAATASGRYKSPSPAPSAADYQHALKQQQQQLHRAAFGSTTPRSSVLGGYPTSSFDSHTAAAAAVTPPQHQHQHIMTGLPPQQRVLRESLPRSAAAAMPLQPMVLVPVPMAALMPAGLMHSSSGGGGSAFEFRKASAAAAAADEAFLRSRMPFNHFY